MAAGSLEHYLSAEALLYTGEVVRSKRAAAAVKELYQGAAMSCMAKMRSLRPHVSEGEVKSLFIFFNEEDRINDV